MSGLRRHGLALTIVLIALAGYLPFAPVRMHDFRAFYCAGKAVAAHADPYREHPLHECEWTMNAPGIPVEADVVTVPAPLPGFVLAVFALLSVLPFGFCALVYIAASLAAVGGTVLLLRSVLEVPLGAIAVSIILPAAIVAIPLGQLAPFAGCGLALCAYGLKQNRLRLAAGGALLTACAPSIALPLFVTLFIGVPRMRVLLLTGTALLAGMSLVSLGLDTNVEYVRTVLHEHARGNVAERSQFSATHFAWAAGLARDPALLLGNVWYIVSCVVGMRLAFVSRRVYSIAALALIPPAFAVFGGLYVHFDQLVLAIPAFLTIVTRARMRPWPFAAIFVLAVPWLALTVYPPFALALVILGAIYAGNAGFPGLGLRLGAGCALLLVIFFAIALATVHPSTSAFRFEPPFNPSAELSWSRYVAWRDPGPDPLYLLLQMPTVAAFLVCLAGLLRGKVAALPAAG